MKISVLIPAYNEASQIGLLINELRQMNITPIVVDDGSFDDTGKEAEKNGAKIIKHRKNMGKGASLKTGFEYILDEEREFDAILIMDGDGQHSPGDIHKFTKLAEKEENSFIIGNRMNNVRNMPLSRKLTNKFMSLIISGLCGQNIPDTQCGFRLLKKDLVKKINIEFSRFEVESELLIKASRLGSRILSVPIQTLYGQESSQINPFQDTIRFISFLVKYIFKKSAR
ncbi:MAG: glycosyltransferase family 2 protein [Candidatus Omnitrophica bacterium]|nr:glycosyltransferase family 2 protein [Candidatus Omnitrophota bacterium]